MNIKIHFIWLVLLALSCGEVSTSTEKSSEASSETANANTPDDPQVNTLSNVELSSIPSDSMAIDSTSLTHGLFPCGPMSPTPYIREIAAKHSGIPYTNDPTTQTAGIFQRFLKTLREQCPEAESRTPSDSGVSHTQAKWYYDKQALTLIKDPLQQADLIQPGMAMFFGKKDQAFYNTQPVDQLWNRDGINHIGIVVEVNKNGNGEVESYTLFHGIRQGKASGITDYHRRNAGKFPPFGTGNNTWVGIAPVVVPN